MAKGFTSLTQERKRMQRIFLIPLVFSIAVLVGLPIISLVGISFSSLKLSGGGFSLNGLSNYIKLLSDSSFLKAAGNTLIIVVGSISLQMILGIAIALLIHHTKFLQGTLRILILLPMVIPPIIVGIMWQIILMPSYGGVDVLLKTLGITNVPDWLGNPQLALISLIVVSAWAWTPFVVLFMLAGLQSLPITPFEAAKIDGANWFQEIRHITLPLLGRLMGVVIILRLIETLKIFPVIFGLTGGGPGNATEDIAFYVYKEGFTNLNLGYASSAAMMLFIVMGGVILIGMWIGKIRSKKTT